MTLGIIIGILLVVAGMALWGGIILHHRRSVSRTPEWVHQTTHRIPADQLIAWIDEVVNARQLYRQPNMSAKQLATELKLPERQMKHAINYACNKTVTEYLNDRRIQAACTMLRKKKCMSIDRISQQTGFASPKAFQTVFIRTMGQTPDDYRRQMK